MSSKKKNDQYAEEIMAGGFDQLLDEAELSTVRIEHEMPSRSNVFKNISAPINNNERLKTAETSNMLDLDEVISELLDPALVSTEPITPKSEKPNEPTSFSFQHEYKGVWTAFLAQQKFCDALKAAIQKSYSVKTTITKSHDRSCLENLTYIIEFNSTEQTRIDQAKASFETLFNSTVETKNFDDQAGFWVRYPDCIRVIQAYSDANEHLHILYEHGAIGLLITFFSKDKSTVLHDLCTNDASLTKIIQEKFLSTEISLPTTSDLMNENKSYLAQDILKLKTELEPEPILIILEQRRIRLFGLVDSVKTVENQIEDIKKKYASNTFKLSLEPQQIKYMLDIREDELKALEISYQNTKIFETLEKGEFTAPSYLHETIAKQIMAISTLCPPIQLEISDEAFCVIAHNECPNIIKIGRDHKCQIEIQEESTDHIMQIPKAATQDHISNELTAAAIDIRKGDLAEQTVDLVVVNSTSALLCNGILEKAGASVKQKYSEAMQLFPSEPFEIDSGELKCRKLLFLQWNMNQSSKETFYQSIRDFVAKAVEYGIKAHHTSIAFPSIGCGLLDFDKNIIANEMLIEAQKQLLTANVLLQIIFVILRTQNDVLKVFQAKLENLQKGNAEKKYTEVPYKLTTLTITIVSPNTEKQEECKKALNDHVQKSAGILELHQEDVLRKWTQPAINEFYKLCVNQSLIIDMNILIGYLKLFGSKELVKEAKHVYTEIKAKQSEQARLIAVARDIVWAHKIDENTSEKYLPALNARIEDAYSSKVPSFTYTDNQSQEYTIHFENMKETCVTNQIQRDVIRHAGFSLPENWQVQSNNLAQFQVKSDSDEFREIRALFDKTMTNKYVEIVRIDRIQNKQWYMQYSSYKSFSPKKDTERKLFHGCPQHSTQLIIYSFFNRSFAGDNVGALYGQGAYFSANALYSHSYARPSAVNGERHMFVADVLVGKTAIGKSGMKTPPLGCDSTTDGDHIFVTYRDDQAYAAYLIVYK